jgi:transposase
MWRSRWRPGGPIVRRPCCRRRLCHAGRAAPIPASSGQTMRVRLNRSGDRQLNQALHLVVLTRLRYDPATRAYAQRRRAEGKTNREIRRCLVRYVTRQLYRLLEHPAHLDPT